MTQINQIRSNGFTQVRTLEYGSRGLTSKNNNLYLREANNREMIGENTRSENVTKTMKKTKISQMNEKNEGTPTGYTATQFRWLPQGSVGNTEG